jgi:hypothetical protein
LHSINLLEDIMIRLSSGLLRRMIEKLPRSEFMCNALEEIRDVPVAERRAFEAIVIRAHGHTSGWAVPDTIRHFLTGTTVNDFEARRMFGNRSFNYAQIKAAYRLGFLKALEAAAALQEERIEARIRQESLLNALRAHPPIIVAGADSEGGDHD